MSARGEHVRAGLPRGDHLSNTNNTTGLDLRKRSEQSCQAVPIRAVCVGGVVSPRKDATTDRPAVPFPTGDMPDEARPAWSALVEAAGRHPPPCSTNPAAWFEASQREHAVEVCLRCPLREPCAAYADAAEEGFGVWGGVDRREQHRRRSREQRAQRDHDR